MVRWLVGKKSPRKNNLYKRRLNALSIIGRDRGLPNPCDLLSLLWDLPGIEPNRIALVQRITEWSLGRPSCNACFLAL